jgi:UDP-GlcNAc:undecaprenyl-phosphate GlcNAc-1-phosphate transferase
MLDFYIKHFHLPNLILCIAFFYTVYYVAISIWSKNQNWIKKSYAYSGKQRVHKGEIPRLAGFIFYINLIIFSFFLSDINFAKELQKIILCLIPMMLVTVKEDLSHNVDYRIRFLGLILSSILLVIYTQERLPVVDHIIIISDLFQSQAFSIFFFSLCLISLANGCNFIDGMNGLLGFFIISALISCMHLAYLVDNFIITLPLILYGLLTILFLVVNYPWGKIFMGDSGAYLLAMLVGIWVIDFFGAYETISSWNAALIFFYPIAEVTYSFIRKLYQKKSPFQPDRAHLHLKVFDLLNKATNNPNLSNNLTTFFLSWFWLVPPLILPWVYKSQMMIAMSVLILTLIYLILNRVISARD